MSVASADAALLSAARAYASLKMDQKSSSSASSSSNTLPPSSPAPVTPTKAKPPIRYSRKQLLALADSPLCVRPEALAPLKDWFGEFDPPTFKQPQSAPTNTSLHPPFTRPHTTFQSTESILSSSINASFLPMLGRGQPPARNPFSNFGKFGADESQPGSLGLSLNQTSNQPNNIGLKGARRSGMERDCAPHLARTQDQSLASENQRRRLVDPSYSANNNPSNATLAKDRNNTHRQQNAGDTHEAVKGPRRGHAPDRERDDKAPNSRTTSKEDSEEHPHWRKQSQAANGSHQKPPNQRDQIHPPHEKDRAANKGRAEKPNLDWHADEHLLIGGGSLQPKQRVKDGAWDAGEGKWDTKKTASDTDAIQAWKAEMKAMDAKKKAAAAAAAMSGPSVLNEPDQKPANPVSIKLSELEQTFNDQTNSNHSSAKTTHFASLLPVNTSTGFSPPSGAEEGEARASRFAKFFDSSKDEYDLRQPPPSAPSHLAPDDQAPDEASKSLHRSASADPENMARVLSMLQMSSQHSNEPGVPQSDVSQLFRQMVPAVGTSQSHTLEPPSSSYAPHQHPSPPRFNPPQSMTSPTGPGASSHLPMGYSKQDVDFTRRPTSVGNNGLGYPPSRGSQHHSPVNQMRALEELLTQDQQLLAGGFGGQQVLPGQASMNALVQQMNLLGNRSKATNEMHLLGQQQQQQQQQQERNQDSQKLAFLARQLQQQRLSPAAGAGALLAGPQAATNRAFANAYGPSPIEHQRRFSGALQNLPPPPPPPPQLFSNAAVHPLYQQQLPIMQHPYGRGPFAPPLPPQHHPLPIGARPQQQQQQAFGNPFLGPVTGQGFNPLAAAQQGFGAGVGINGVVGQQQQQQVQAGGGPGAQMDLMSLLNASSHRRIGGNNGGM